MDYDRLRIYFDKTDLVVSRKQTWFGGDSADLTQVEINSGILKVNEAVIALNTWAEVDPLLNTDNRDIVLRDIVVGGNGQATAFTIHQPVQLSITAPMQLTVSNGGCRGQVLSLPLAGRQVNIVADPVYAKDIEVAIIRQTATGNLDVLLAENGAEPPVGWTTVQSLLKFELPVGTTDLSTLGVL